MGTISDGCFVKKESSLWGIALKDRIKIITKSIQISLQTQEN